MSKEADTCRTYIVPKLHASGWEDDFIVLQELQVKSGEELSALMPSVLDKAFKGEL
jgi:hypothetical protein